MANLPCGIKTKEEEKVVKKLNGVPGIGLLGKDQGNNETENDNRGGDLGRKGEAATADKRPETDEANPKIAKIKNGCRQQIYQDQFDEDAIIFVNLPGLRQLSPIEAIRRLEHTFRKPEWLKEEGKPGPSPETRENKQQTKKTDTQSEFEFLSQDQGGEQ